MYVIKNAFKCIGRAKSRNLLIGVIVFVLAVSACIGLSIRQAAESAKTSALDQLSVTATISFDRQSMMNNKKPPEEGASSGADKRFDREQFTENMNKAQGLTLEEYKTYATATSVKDFYYTLTVYCNGSEGLEPITTESQDNTPQSDTKQENSPFGGGMMNNPMGGKGQMMAGMNTNSDFTLVGYSSDAAMTDFSSGVSSVTSGSVFAEGSGEYTCIISAELAAYNDLAVGDSISLTNANQEEEIYP
ncbi:MAG: ABC transporter permease, partial [Clostridia bacterium]|nr:ABC transporter permease [Clostridia bacterium]